MNKDVIICIKGNQQYDYDDHDDSIELITEGKYYKKGEKYFLTYKETEMTGMEGTTTTLKIDDGKVTIMRFGKNNSQLIFEKGQKHVCYYETEYGSFTVGVFSNFVDIDIDDTGGEIAIDYFLEVNSSKTQENDFHLQIREASFTSDKLNRNCKKPN